MDFSKIIQDIESSSNGFESLQTTIREKSNDKEKILDALKERLEFYKQQNANMEDLCQKLKYQIPSLGETKRALDDLRSIQEKYGSKDISIESTLMSGLSLAERVRKQNNYIARIKMCTKMYINLNDKLSSDVKIYKRESEYSDNHLKNFDVPLMSSEVKALETKIRKYEKEILKLEAKYPWMKNQNLNLTNIANEMEALNRLRGEKHKLKTELESFQGLKPDIVQARQQLNEIKDEYNKYNKLLSNGDFGNNKV